jgi:transcriptional regulator with XRE-family HTH domain
MSNNFAPRSFAEVLSSIRKDRGLSQKALAIAASMDQSYVSGLETGRRPAPKARQIARLASALNATSAEQALLHEAGSAAKLARVADAQDRPRRQLLARLIVTARLLSDADIMTVDRMARGMLLTPMRTEGRENIMSS